MTSKPASKPAPKRVSKPATNAPAAEAKAKVKVKSGPETAAKNEPKADPKADPKAAIKSPTNPAKPTKPVKSVKPAKVAKPGAVKTAGAGRDKLVRDSFTMPRSDYALIQTLKDRALGFRHAAKKSELLRAGLQALNVLSDAQLQTLLVAQPQLKAGRPRKGR